MGLFDVGGGGFTAAGDPFGDQVRNFGANTTSPAGGAYDEEVRARAKAMRMGAVPAPQPAAPTPVAGTSSWLSRLGATGRSLLSGLGTVARVASSAPAAGAALALAPGDAGAPTVITDAVTGEPIPHNRGVPLTQGDVARARIPTTGADLSPRQRQLLGAQIDNSADAKVRGLQEQTAARTVRVNEVIAASQAARGADVVSAREASPVFPRGPSSYGDAFRFLMDLGRYKTQVKDQNEAITERRIQEASRARLLEAGIAANSKVIPIKGADMTEGAVRGDTYLRPDPKAPGGLAVSKVPAPKNEVKFGPGLDPAAVKRSAEAHVKANPDDRAEINRQLRASGYKFQL